jgi:hypothetical protein
MKGSLYLFALLATTCLCAGAQDLKQAFERKFLVAQREGLAVGICAASTSAMSRSQAELAVKIEGTNAEYHTQTGATAMLSGCREIVPEPIGKGEVLRVQRAWFQGDTFHLLIVNFSPHALERGFGKSLEHGLADLRFKIAGGKKALGAEQIVNSWVKPYDTAEEAAKFGNTASGAFVKEVKLGMSVAEVESALGLPETRVDLGDRLLYKYKTLTVEFRSGKVADVR